MSKWNDDLKMNLPFESLEKKKILQMTRTIFYAILYFIRRSLHEDDSFRSVCTACGHECPVDSEVRMREEEK